MNYRILLSSVLFLATLAVSREPHSTSSRHFSLSYTVKSVFNEFKEAFSRSSPRPNTIQANPISDLSQSDTFKKITDIPRMNSSQEGLFQEITADSESEIYKTYKNLPVPWQTESIITRILEQAEEISQYPHLLDQNIIEFLAVYGVDAAEKNRFYGLSNNQYGYKKDIPSAQAGLQHAFFQGKGWAKETLYDAYSYGWYGYAQNIEKAKDLLKEPSSNKANYLPLPSQRKYSKKRKELIIPSHYSHVAQYKLVCEYFGLPVP